MFSCLDSHPCIFHLRNASHKTVCGENFTVSRWELKLFILHPWYFQHLVIFCFRNSLYILKNFVKKLKCLQTISFCEGFLKSLLWLTFFFDRKWRTVPQYRGHLSVRPSVLSRGIRVRPLFRGLKSSMLSR